MTTYSIREFKARVSEILRDLDEGQEVIITRRGKPCGRLTTVQRTTEGKRSLSTLRGSLDHLPDASYEDFLDIKTLWKARLPASDEEKQSRPPAPNGSAVANAQEPSSMETEHSRVG